MASDREIEYDKDSAAVPGYSELKTAENWVHLNAVILNGGRTKHVVPPGTANVEEELDKLIQNEPYVARLRPINEDESIDAFFCRSPHKKNNIRVWNV